LSDRHDRALIAFVNALSGINHRDALSASRWLHSPAGRTHMTEWFRELNATPGIPQDGTTDYGIAEADTAALDRACTEEWMRRAKLLADDLYDIAREEAEPNMLGLAKELATLIYKLGIHLDATAGYSITGGTAP
jgi:hypothetical protein